MFIILEIKLETGSIKFNIAAKFSYVSERKYTGTERALPINIANMISNDVKFIPPRIGEVQETLASNEKFKGLTGWTPKVSLMDWLQDD